MSPVSERKAPRAPHLLVRPYVGGTSFRQFARDAPDEVII